MQVYFIFSGGRKERWINNKNYPSEFFYGFKELSNLYKNISFLEEQDLGIKPQKSVLSIFFRKLSLFSFGIPLEMIYGFLRNKKFLKFTYKDTLVLTTNGIGLTLAFAKKIGLLKCNIIFIAMGLIPRNSSFFRTLIYKFIISKVTLLVISLQEEKYLKILMPKKTIHYLSFGVDNKFWNINNKNKKQEDYIFAIGNDKNRDWQTLIDSWESSFPILKIVTSKVLRNYKKNIQIIRGDWKKNLLTDEEILAYYRDSKFVIVPLIDTMQPAGQSVCLQAMSCEKPVIMSKISGIWDNNRLIHKENVFLVKPNDSSLLNNAINELLRDKILQKTLAKNGKELVDQLYNVEIMSKQLKKYIDQNI